MKGRKQQCCERPREFSISTKEEAQEEVTCSDFSGWNILPEMTVRSMLNRIFVAQLIWNGKFLILSLLNRLSFLPHYMGLTKVYQPSAV